MEKKGCNRREFVKTASVGLLGGYVGLKSGAALAGMMGGGGMGGGMGGGGGGMGGGGVIDPPPGAAFIDPVPMPFTNPAPGVVEVNLRAMINRVKVNGTWADLLTYNGYYPGPVIRVRKGDILRVNFANFLPPTVNENILGFTQNITNIHTHGWHVSPQEPADNVMRQFAPGQATGFDSLQNPYPPYEYDTSLQPAGTLSFYHPHMHGLVAEQVWGGLAGPIVVEDETTVLSGFETHLLVLKDINLSGGAPAPYTSSMEYMQGKEGDTVMVNGLVNPVLTVRPGQVQRWRILNASQARFYKLSLANHTLQVVGTDGGWLDKPYPQSYILLSPGERVDVLVKASATAGSYKFLSLPYSRMGMMSSAQITLLTLAVSGGAVKNTIPATINANAKRIDPNRVSISGQKTITLSMMGGRGYINGHDFDVQPYVGYSQTGTYEVWTVVNQSNMDHPWHQHTNEGQVLSISGGDALYAKLYTQAPARKDVVIIPKMGSVKMLMPVMDYEGMAMFHCHILEHEDIGMIAVWQIGMDM
jgi:FtsP/CotA-like multicopper oxidase with cupredoxin domain